MLTYNQRYRPRTEREYTKTDLTVYDSAGNTALRGLKVYGKSEVVDGTIKSAGEGYAVVDLGTLNWIKITVYTNPIFIAEVSGKKVNNLNYMCAKYVTSNIITGTTTLNAMVNGEIGAGENNSNVYICDTNSAYTDATAFKTAMQGVLLCYELADPSQGNTIAIKTDDGSGINGTMATFTTGTPLYGVSDTARDVMEWDGSSGEVTKKCGELDLGTLNWTYHTSRQAFATSAPFGNQKIVEADEKSPYVCSKYATQIAKNYNNWTENPNKSIFQSPIDNLIVVIDTDYTDATAFKSAMNGVMLIYELATPVVEQLTQAENNSIANLRTFDGTTHIQNNASTDMTVNYTIKVPTIS